MNIRFTSSEDNRRVDVSVENCSILVRAWFPCHNGCMNPMDAFFVP